MILRRSTACGNLPNNVRSAEGESGREEGGKGGGRSRLGEQHQIVVDRGGGRSKLLLRWRVPKINTFMGQCVDIFGFLCRPLPVTTRLGDGEIRNNTSSMFLAVKSFGGAFPNGGEGIFLPGDFPVHVEIIIMEH